MKVEAYVAIGSWRRLITFDVDSDMPDDQINSMVGEKARELALSSMDWSWTKIPTRR